MNRTIVCLGYIRRSEFAFLIGDDEQLVAAMLTARDDRIIAVHWNDLRPDLSTDRAWDVRLRSWTSVDLGRCDAILILEAPAAGSISADFPRCLAAMRLIDERGIPTVNSVKSFLTIPDKRYLIERNDMPFPRTRLLTADSNVEELLADFSGTVVVKPLIGRGGSGVVRLPCVAADIRAALEPGKCYLLQEYLPAIVDGERSLYFFSKRYRYAVIKRPREGDFRSNRAHAGTQVYEPTTIELALACTAIERFDSPSLIERVDLCDGRIIEMTIGCPGFKLDVCDIASQMAEWTYEAIDLTISRGSTSQGH